MAVRRAGCQHGKAPCPTCPYPVERSQRHHDMGFGSGRGAGQRLPFGDGQQAVALLPQIGDDGAQLSDQGVGGDGCGIGDF